MRKLFGTDGVRGKANHYPITAELALMLGKATAHVFGAAGLGLRKAILGKDTRLSGYMLENAITSGMLSMGMDVISIGPLPTPAVAHLTRSMCASCGVMITASHNPATDNGIKIFGHDGFKLADEIELEIEGHILKGKLNSELIPHHQIGKAFRIDDARGRYIEFAKSSIDNHSLKGLKIVLDCANGAAYYIAPLIFRELGAEVITTAVSPDGHNINAKCGATHSAHAAALVKKHKADLSVSLDGDGDRVIFCDADGNEVNGDRIIGMVALDFKSRGRLADNSIVVTGMSNLGLVKAMEKVGIKVIQTGVGDRYVIEEMRKNNLNIGGEQSGHIIFMDYATTGDGIITALHVLKQMLKTNRTLKEAAAFMEVFPQRLEGVKVQEKIPIDQVPALRDAIVNCEKALAGSGRTVVRYSGTENKLRILVEAKKQQDVDFWIHKLCDIASRELT
ncbi:MAG: phosphoglucosamine mutase [Victivallales bacterium]|nr:phosphoglucosamine mutase [Victivallales bacterium]